MPFHAVLRRSNANGMQALGSGVPAALCIHCATALAVLVSNSATNGGVGILVGMTILPRVGIGSASVSQTLLVRQGLQIPPPLIFGDVLFLRSPRIETRQLGHMMIGVALILSRLA